VTQEALTAEFETVDSNGTLIEAGSFTPVGGTANMVLAMAGLLASACVWVLSGILLRRRNRKVRIPSHADT